MLSTAASIQAYISAKDGNRPHLLEEAFIADAELQMVVKTAAISFPPSTIGRNAIVDVLVRQFNQTYENIYTLCLGEPPLGNAESFTCGWLVAMSEKQSGAVRVGCGQYEWSFRSPGYQISALSITIVAMETMPPEMLNPVMAWVSSLPYPWCSIQAAVSSAPALTAMRSVLQQLGADV